MERILEDVAERHRGQREAVDKNGFELPLCEVSSYENEGEGLKLRWGGKRSIAGIGVDVRP